MKYFRKHKKKVFALCLSAVLLSCFMGFSVSSSAANITENIPLTSISWWSIHNQDWYNFQLGADGVFSLGPISALSTPEPYFSVIYCHVTDIPPLPSVDGKSVFLSVSLDVTVSLDGSLRFAVANGGDILDAAAFRSCKLSAGSLGVYDPVAFTLLDHTGAVVDVDSESFWRSFANDGGLLKVNAIFDITSLIPFDIQSFDFFFPSSYSDSDLILWASSTDYSYQLRVDNCDMHYTYKPFNDVVQDDLSDIKGSLSGVNNKLDSISSSMNTIDQDVNRVNQTVSDLKDSFEDFQDDLTTPNTDIFSSNSQLQDKITDVQDQISSIDKEVNDAVDGVLDKVPGAENPFVGPDVPVLGDIWAKQFIDDLWGFIKSYSILYTFIHTGLLFCLASFILRR